MDKEQCDRQSRDLVLHAEQIAKLFSQIQDTNDRLLAIEKSILQLKYMAYGFIFYGISSQAGLLAALKI